MDLNTPENISRLLFRYLSGTITGEEEAELKLWREQSVRHEQLFQRLIAGDDLRKGLGQCPLPGDVRKKEWNAILAKTTRKKRRLIFQWAKYAAIFILPVMLSIFFLRREMPPKVLTTVPDKTVATLTLENGTVVNLEKLSEDKIYVRENSRFCKSGDTLRYEQEGVGGEDTVVKYNSLYIPRGSQYYLALNDGTVVYLNSETYLRYPVEFKGKKREVELKGEGYFDVKKDASRPFVVHAANVAITVLGTSFAIRAYQDESQILTTLVEGSVNVRKNAKEVVLFPSQQAVCGNNSADIAVHTVNVDNFIAWKQGRLVFDNVRLEDIITTVQRWYDFEVFYQNNDARDLRYSINIVRYDEFSRFLNVIEETGSVRFEIKGRSVVVK